VYLCEITYANPPKSLFKRLDGWDKDWPLLRVALERDSGVPVSWSLTPWLFVPQSLAARVETFLTTLSLAHMPKPRITHLEQVMPWQYRSWNRATEHDNRPEEGLGLD
jgi:hypothetical protein